MNRAIYIRNLTIFLLFVAVLFATPYLFAQSTSPSLIRIDNTSVNLYNRSYSNNVNTTLEQGSIIRLPDPIVENLVLDAKGNIAMAETLLVWKNLAAADHRLLPKQVNGKLVYPVKVLKGSDSKFDVNSRDGVGYLPLTDLLRPGTFNTVRADQKDISKQEEAQALTTEENAEVATQEPTSSEKVFFYDPDNTFQFETEEEPEPLVALPDENTQPSQGTSETTSPNGSIRPKTRPERPTYSLRPTHGTYAPSMNPEFKCYHSDYKTSYKTSNCFAQAGMTIEERAEHVLGDLNAINQWRLAASGKASQPMVDPRFSLCIGYHESNRTFGPNTSSGGGDYGIFQIRNTTGAGVMANAGMITPGFTHFDRKLEYYRVNGKTSQGLKSKMAGNPLAQADLHHSIVIEKAAIADSINTSNYTNTHCRNGITQRLGMGSATPSDYQCLADFYNARGKNGGPREGYARKIRRCYDRMLTGVIDDAGNITNKNRLEWALEGAM